LFAWAIAEQLLSSPRLAQLDAEPVRAGCLLPGIGVSRLYGKEGRLDHAHFIRQALLGREILKVEGGSPNPFHRFCSHHTGVGPTRQDIETQGLPLRPADCSVETEEGMQTASVQA
jgi:uncharacterized protein